MADYQVHAGKDLRIPFAFLTKSGTAAKIDGAPGVSGDNDAAATFALDGGFVVASSVAVGTANFTITGDADLGEGVTPVTRTASVDVIDENADSVQLGEGVEVDKP